MIIAIDGPSGAGKSTIAKLISEKLGFEYIDTGAMYRALAYKAHKNNTDFTEEEIGKMLDNTEINYIDKKVYVDGECVENFIRTEKISMLSSKISKLKNVRTKMVELQRKIAKNKNVVMDGRDIGTNVFPNADYKFFITASIEERAIRRFKELHEKGLAVKYEDILEDIKLRDENDINRQHSPLVKADDAILIDNSNYEKLEVTNYILNIIGGRHVL